MDRLLCGALATAAIGLLVLGGLVHLLARSPVPIQDLSRHEGQRACTLATVVLLQLSETGRSRVVLRDANTSVPARAPFAATLVPGDRVLACGDVERSTAGIELSIGRPEDLRVERAWDAQAAPLADVAAHPWELADLHLLIPGVLQREGARLYLVDPVSSARIRTLDSTGAALGVPVRTEGFLAYDSAESLFRFRVDRATPAAAP